MKQEPLFEKINKIDKTLARLTNRDKTEITVLG